MPELAPTASAAGAAPATAAGAAVHSVATSLPVRVVGNERIADRLGIAPDWIVTRTGVRERHRAAPGELLYAFAAEAGAGALDAGGLDPGEVDLVLVATMSHEQLTPSAAALVAAEIGAVDAGAIDLNVACSGFVAALGMAAGQIESGRARTVLAIGADLLSSITDPDDRATAALFGDGAGAALVSAIEPPGRVGRLVLGADGRNAGLIHAPRDGYIQMRGPDTFRHAVARLAEATLASLEAEGLELGDVDLFVYHQANSRIIAAVGERLGLPAQRTVDCIAAYGNTSAASIPLALATAEREGRLADGARVLLAAFGGGLTWAATTITWGLGGGA